MVASGTLGWRRPDGRCDKGVAALTEAASGAIDAALSGAATSCALGRTLRSDAAVLVEAVRSGPEASCALGRKQSSLPSRALSECKLADGLGVEALSKTWLPAVCPVWIKHGVAALGGTRPLPPFRIGEVGACKSFGGGPGSVFVSRMSSRSASRTFFRCSSTGPACCTASSNAALGLSDARLLARACSRF